MSLPSQPDAETPDALIRDLQSLGQDHLMPFLTALNSPLLAELLGLKQHYHGGVQQYIRNAQQLLQQQQLASAAPEAAVEFASLEQPPRIFHAPSLLTPSPELDALETEGAALLRQTVFVLVAGGLGERLGFSGIKLSLPVDTASERTYLAHYMQWIRSGAGADAPLVIMTSDDTHAATVKELALIAQLQQPPLRNVTIVKQETVPCILDGAARIAVTREGQLLRKPHGHGDVHSLLFAARRAASASNSDASSSSSPLLVDEWLAAGRSYIVFLQDTNASAVLTVPVSLAISARERLAMNLTCVPRMPKEAIGLLCHVGGASKTADGSIRRQTVNIEYNKFEPVAKQFFGHGDVPAPGSPFSAFPGSINTLLYRLDVYVAKLQASNGQVPEFINPKYADAAKTTFKTPSRVESLMQDFALLFDNDQPDERVGGTVFERQLYHPVKNSLVEGMAKVKDCIDAHCAASGEENVLVLQRKRLQALGVAVAGAASATVEPQLVGGVIPVSLFPVVSVTPALSASFASLRQAFPTPEQVTISDRSVLIVEGNVEIRRLDLDGTLVVKALGPDTRIVVDGLSVSNAGWKLTPVNGTAAGADEVTSMRGYRFTKAAGDAGAAAVFVEQGPGDFAIRNDGLSRI